MEPTAPWLDKELVQLWLKTHHGSVTVKECELQTVAGKGDNYLSNMHRLLVKTDTGKLHHLIIKCRMEEGSAANIMRESEIFKKEQQMYEHTLPRISHILEKALAGNFEPFLPLCFYACKNFLVMEDLNAAGFRMLNRREGLDLDHCVLVMRTLARFHAASAVLHQQDPDCIKGYEIHFFSEKSTENAWSKWQTGMARTMAEELETWPEEWSPYLQKMKRLQENILDRIQQTTRQRESDFNVLIHGDLWINNLMFMDKASAIRLVDFQFANYASFALDLQLFFVSSTTYEVLVNHMDHLLKEYHKTLQETLVACGFKETPITREQMIEEFERKSMYGLFGLVCCSPVMMSDPNCGFNLDKALETGDNPGPSMYSERYKKILKWTLPILDKMGAFEENNSWD